MPAFYIENLGCAKNQVDAEVMGRHMQLHGWEWTGEADSADFIIVNTCGFIEPAQQESIDTTLSLIHAYPDTPVAMAGCMAQRFADDLVRGMPEIAGVFGNRQPGEVVRFVEGVLGRAPGAPPYSLLPDGEPRLVGGRRDRLLSHPGSAYMKIAEGCEHNCSFCAIPSIRGRLRTRTISDVVEEFRHFRERGIYEFNLIAQDLAAWRDDDAEFTTLIRTLLREEGEFWLRPLYLYPDTFPDEILEIASSDGRFLPYFDLSFQHASRDVLRRMGRPGSADSYLRLIERIRSVLPDVALRSSFIVGFPGEGENDIQELMDFIDRAELEWVGVFEFSPQTGTAAAKMKPKVPVSLARERKRSIEHAQEAVVYRRLSRFEGRALPVLVEECMDGVPVVLGRSPLQAPDVDGLVVVHGVPDSVTPGQIIRVKVTGVTGVDMQGQFLQ